jgi:GNAT superfamily N-acetyltransferase
MASRIVDVDLENFHLVPRDCRATVYWEMEQVDPDVNARFQKEEWLSATLLEWGRCGKLLVAEDGAGIEAEGVGFAEYAPPTLFDRLQEFPTGRDASDDAVYLAYVYVEDGWRGQGLGSALLRAVARDAVDRGYAAVEAIGDRRSQSRAWVLPVTFLAANGFRVVRDDERHPLLRLDLRGREETLVNLTEQQLPAFEPDPAG